MTDIKKTAMDKGSAKAKKLAMNIETIRDLNTPKDKAAKVRGGRDNDCRNDPNGPTSVPW